jgi:competence protein ComEA
MPSFAVSRRLAVAVVVAVLAAVFLAAHLLAAKPRSGSITVEGAGTGSALPRGPASGSTRTSDVRYVVVDVAGEVRRPGVYRLRQGARITDALARAGGATTRAQVTLVDLAAPLADGEQVLVPGRFGAPGPAGGATAGGSPSGSSAGPVDLNTASAEQKEHR